MRKYRDLFVESLVFMIKSVISVSYQQCSPLNPHESPCLMVSVIRFFTKTSTFIMKTLEFHSEKSQAFHKISWLNYEMFHFPWPNSDGESISLGGLNSRQDGIRSNPGAAATGRTWRMDETIWVAKMGWVAYISLFFVLVNLFDEIQSNFFILKSLLFDQRHISFLGDSLIPCWEFNLWWDMLETHLLWNILKIRSNPDCFTTLNHKFPQQMKRITSKSTKNH